MKSFLRSLPLWRAKQEDRHVNVPNEEDQSYGSPFFLMMGSLTGCTLKDAQSYAKGLAEKYLSTLDATYYRVYHDKLRNRFIYEIHDGGPALSIIDAVHELLNQGQSAHIRLANGGYATIKQERDLIFTLVCSDANDVHPTHNLEESAQSIRFITEFISPDKKLDSLHAKSAPFRYIGTTLMLVSLPIFVLSASVFVLVASGALSDDELFFTHKRQEILDRNINNPLTQLEFAKKELKPGQHLHQLSKSAKGWTWEIAP